MRDYCHGNHAGDNKWMAIWLLMDYIREKSIIVKDDDKILDRSIG